MAGLLNPSAAMPSQQTAPQPSQGGMGAPSGKQDASPDSLNDPLLKQVEQGIEQAVPPEHQQMYQSIVVAGMHVMFSKETSQLLDQQLAVSDDVVANVSDGISKLIMIVFNEAKQPVDQFVPAAGLASISLMCQALDYWESANDGKVTSEIIAECTKQTVAKVLSKFGITQDQVSKVVAAGSQVQGGQNA